MSEKANRIDLFTFRAAPMRAFHLTWMAFFVCFFAWFASAPLMPVLAREFALTPGQVADINIAAVAATILVRLIVGPLCDRYGPRRVYAGLMALGAIPVAALACATGYTSVLLCRLGIGAVGASFVITQYHTSVMFGPKVVGTANAASAGWGNSGAGAAQALMPMLLAAFMVLGMHEASAWRLALLVPALALLIMAAVYWRYTQDCPQGDFLELRKQGIAIDGGKKTGLASFGAACANYRVWMLFVTYGCCFGVELFVHTVAATYYVNHFHLSLGDAGLAAGIFGLLALFARALGGILSDRTAKGGDLSWRAPLLAALLLGEGLGLLWFAHAQSAGMAIAAMVVFGLFTHMACGATYALVPFIDRKALGGVAGIVGAGGNVGAVAAGFVMKGVGDVQQTVSILGVFVACSALCALAVRLGAGHLAETSPLAAAPTR
ncbi:MAG: MFS transporter [Bordetella sp.]|uniref:MFS transporter n=1 Tax=Bordetella sp. TaxID=28081 RepID=UPI003F7B9519